MTVDRWTIQHLDAVMGSGTTELQMQAARGDQRHPIQYAIAISGLSNLDGAEAVQSFGKGSRKLFWHMLHYDQTRRVGRKRTQNPLQGDGSTG